MKEPPVNGNNDENDEPENETGIEMSHETDRGPHQRQSLQATAVRNYGGLAASHDDMDPNNENNNSPDDAATTSDGLWVMRDENNNNNPIMDGHHEITTSGIHKERAQSVYHNFCLLAVLFSAVPAASLACLSLATARLGELGAWQSGTLYLSYTASALFCAVSLVKTWGSKSALQLGMSLYCIYIFGFLMAIVFPSGGKGLALTGGVVGGIGAGIMWTSQGTYFSQAASEYASLSGLGMTQSTSYLGGRFAFVLLVEETTLDLVSTILIRVFHVHWAFVFTLYLILAVSATALITRVKEYPKDGDGTNNQQGRPLTRRSALYKTTATVQLLMNDSKMKYMIGLNAAFAFASVFLNSFVNGEVIPVALHDSKTSLVGLLTAVHGLTAAIASLGFGALSRRIGKGPILHIGAICFAWVAAPFLIQPDLERWTFLKLVGIYVVEGIGRATFEGTFKAIFADYFSYEKEGAFGNIILQNGISAAVAYILSVQLSCPKASTFCLEYRDGSLHNMETFAACTILVSVLGIIGFARASCLYHRREGTFDSGDTGTAPRPRRGAGYGEVEREDDPIQLY